MASRSNASRHERRTNGICTTCSGKMEPERIGKSLCKSCNDLSCADVRVRRHNQKKRAIELLGGKCIHCDIVSDYICIYDFHHTDPNSKNKFLSTNLFHRSWNVVWAEVQKCELLCANCHRILHAIEDGEID